MPAPTGPPFAWVANAKINKINFTFIFSKSFLFFNGLTFEIEFRFVYFSLAR